MGNELAQRSIGHQRDLQISEGPVQVLGGYRAFKMEPAKLGEPIRLTGGFAQTWTSRTHSARCIDVRSDHYMDDDAPYPNCSCGIYVFKRISPQMHLQVNTWMNFYGRASVVAYVTVWGKIIEHSQGYRAKFARIEHVFMTEHIRSSLDNLGTAQQVRETLQDVPYTIIPKGETMASWVRKQARHHYGFVPLTEITMDTIDGERAFEEEDDIYDD